MFGDGKDRLVCVEVKDSATEAGQRDRAGSNAGVFFPTTPVFHLTCILFVATMRKRCPSGDVQGLGVHRCVGYTGLKG